MKPDSTVSSSWVRSPFWDLLGLGFGWLPFYLWFTFGLRLDSADLLSSEGSANLGRAIFVVLGLTYVHRHYTLLLVYADPRGLAERRRAYVLAPLVVIALTLAARYSGLSFGFGGQTVSTWLALLTIGGLWNVWHAIRQRYGFLRIYASKIGHGLETPAQARRDRWLLWGSVLAVSLGCVYFRSATLLGHPNARRLWATLRPIIELPQLKYAVYAVLAATTLGILLWIRGELRVARPLGVMAPRWWFAGSTFALFAVFLVHGPVIGYLCFGSAHALEYIAFVHHFSARKHASAPKVLATTLLGRALPALGCFAALSFGYYALAAYQRTDLYLTYYLVTTLLHYLYDGWIWKVRKPALRTPLGIQPV